MWVLEPLFQNPRWQSQMLGLIQVTPAHDRGRVEVVGIDPEKTDGCIWVSQECVVHFECTLPHRVQAILKNDEDTYGCQRIRWLDAETTSVVDIWDCRLLAKAKEASDSLGSKGVETHFEKALQDLNTTQAKMTSIALCITTMGRLWQLEQALPLNLLHCWPYRKWVKFHVVDFCESDDSADDAAKFMLDHCHAAIDIGLLRVYKSRLNDGWHASIAKNTAHLVAREEIVVNLDGDNLIGPGFPSDINDRFQQGCNIIHYTWDEGSCGRIVCLRDDFLKLRGYDEDAYPMGAQDIDLLDRLKMLPGAHHKRVMQKVHGQAIPNTRQAKVAKCSHKYGGCKWGQMDGLNREIFRMRREAGQVVRNLDRELLGVPVFLVSGEPHGTYPD